MANITAEQWVNGHYNTDKFNEMCAAHPIVFNTIYDAIAALKQAKDNLAFLISNDREDFEICDKAQQLVQESIKQFITSKRVREAIFESHKILYGEEQRNGNRERAICIRDDIEIVLLFLGRKGVN